MRSFSIIWFGQLISTIGSGLTGFALGVWIYEQTGSVTLYSLSILSFILPSVLLSPLAGALVDRWPRRWVMVMSDAGAGLATLAIWLLLAGGRLEIWHVYVANVFNAAFTTFQWPAYSAATTMLVRKEQLGRAGGMVQIGEAISQLISPAVAGFLFVRFGLNSVVLVDFITFAFAVLTLLAVRIPDPERTAEGKAGQGSLLREMAYGWQYIAARKGLLGLLLYFASINFTFGMIGPLLVPMMLEMATADVIGGVFSAIGLGMLFGTIVMSAWGGPKRRVLGVIGSGIVMSFFLMVLGLKPSLLLIGISGFGAMFVVPIMNGSSQALWQTKTAPDVQGRVFSVRRMIAQFTTPIATVIAGPLADRVFQPLMVEGGPLAASLGQVIGVGPGRGTGLLFIVMGVAALAFSLIAFSIPRIRNVERELPDAVVKERTEGEAAVEEAAPATA